MRLNELIVMVILSLVYIAMLVYEIYSSYIDYRNGFYFPNDIMPKLFRLIGIKDNLDKE